MKQESVNQFNGGLVKDLNPLVTPNNVLTDVVNGSFITFNGNELMLQNDMGNIAIRKNVGTETNPIWEDVHLGEGFFPVGIKEYGGILYIVSSRAEATITANGVTIPVPEIYDPELSYSAGSYVSVAKKISIPDGIGGFTITKQPWYYKAMVDIDPQNPPVAGDNTSAIWRLFADYNTPTELTIVETQVGSYPSPEQSNVVAKNARIRLNTWDLLNGVEVQKQFGSIEVSGGTNLEFTVSVIDPEDALSVTSWDDIFNANELVKIDNRGLTKYFILNTSYKPSQDSVSTDYQYHLDLWESELMAKGILVGIESGSELLPSFYSYLSGYDANSKPVKKLFKLNIYQLLSNGAINITPTFKREFVTGGVYYWFTPQPHTAPTSPYNDYVKNRFKGKLVAKLEFEDIDYFSATSPVVSLLSVENQLVWEAKIGISTKTSSFISADKVKVYFNDILFSKDGQTEFEVDDQGLCEITKQFPGSMEGQVVSYVIKPIFNYEDLPLAYTNKYEVSGSFVITSTTMQIAFRTLQTIKEPNLTNPELSRRKTTILVLESKFGGYLDPWYNFSSVPFLFVLNGTLDETISNVVEETLNTTEYRIISKFQYVAYFPKLLAEIGNADLAAVFQATENLYIIDPTAGNYMTTLYNFSQIKFNGTAIDVANSIKHESVIFDDSGNWYTFNQDNNYQTISEVGLYGIMSTDDLFGPDLTGLENLFLFSGESTSFFLTYNVVKYKVFPNADTPTSVYLYIETPSVVPMALRLPISYAGSTENRVVDVAFQDPANIDDAEIASSFPANASVARLWNTEIEADQVPNLNTIKIAINPALPAHSYMQRDIVVLNAVNPALLSQYRTYEWMQEYERVYEEPAFANDSGLYLNTTAGNYGMVFLNGQGINL